MNLASFGAWLAAYKAQIIAGVAAAILLFLLFKSVVRIVRFVVVLAIGTAVGVGISYGLTQLGIHPRIAYWATVVCVIIALLIGGRDHDED